MTASAEVTAAAPLVKAGGQQRILELDILRGLAILLVLGIHSPGERGGSGVLRPIDAFMHQFGWTGVDLFFVLSGFLIGGILFAEIKKYENLNVGRFLMRRMLRIWPAYYCLLLFVIGRMLLESHQTLGQALAQMWPAFVNIQNFIEVPREQLWSLAVEEHFYLALPLLLGWLLAAPRRGVHLIPRIFLGLSVFCLVLRVVLFATTDINLRTQTYLCIDALFCGVTLAYFRAYRPEVLERIAAQRGLLFIALLLFVPALFDGWPRKTFGFSCLYLGYALVLIRFVVPQPGAKLLPRFVASPLARGIGWVGTYSYSIYLWHRDTSWSAYELARDSAKAAGLPRELVWLLHTSAYVGASILGGVVLGKLIEVPVMRLRETMFPPRVPAPGTAPLESGAEKAH